MWTLDGSTVDAGGAIKRRMWLQRKWRHVTLSTTTGGVVAIDAVSITANAGDITVGAITATAGTLGVTATAGSINDAADDNTADFTAGGLITLTAQDEIGVLGSGSDTDLEFAASSSVNVSTTGTGAIDLDGLGALTLTDVDTNDGTITVDAGGAIIPMFNWQQQCDCVDHLIR